MERARRLAFRDMCVALSGRVVAALLVSVVWPAAFASLAIGAALPLLILAATALGALLWHGGWSAFGSARSWRRAALAGVLGAGAGALVGVLVSGAAGHRPAALGTAVLTALCWGLFGLALAIVLPAT